MNLSVKTRSLNPAWSARVPQAAGTPGPAGSAPLRGDRQAWGQRIPGRDRVPHTAPGAGEDANATGTQQLLQAPRQQQGNMLCFIQPPAGQRLEKGGKGNETRASEVGSTWF